MSRGTYEQEKTYLNFMEKCRVDCPEFFKKYHFSYRERRLEYILLSIYIRYKGNGYRPVIITKQELMESYYKKIAMHSVSHTITDLEEKGYITRKFCYGALGESVGNEYTVNGFIQQEA